MLEDAAELKRQLLAKAGARNDKPVHGLSTGSTLLNLACSGNPTIGFLPGHYYFLVGDSASGKTFLSLTCLAEASINPYFKDYRFIFDNAEDGALMNIELFFGSEVSSKIETGFNLSGTIEEFFFHLDDACEAKKPFIYILDSMDALTTEEENSKFTEQKKASRNDKPTTGSYGVSKAKANSAGIRRILPKLKETGSILLIISQTRDNLGFGFEKKTRSGGHALRFYATLEIWSSVVEKLKKTVKGKPRQVGIVAQVHVKKNRITGQEHKVEIPIYHSIGMDDLGSCVDYLIEEKHWEKHGQTVKADEFDFSGTREKLIDWVDQERKEIQLQEIVAKIWQEIQEACRLDRRKRY